MGGGSLVSVWLLSPCPHPHKAWAVLVHSFIFHIKIPLHSNRCRFQVTVLQTLCKRSVAPSPSRCFPGRRCLTAPLLQTAREGGVAGWVAILGATVPPPAPPAVCEFLLPSGDPAWEAMTDWVKQHWTSSAGVVGDFLGHKPSCLCDFLKTNTCWDAHNLQEGCLDSNLRELEVTLPELSPVPGVRGRMESSFFVLSWL